MRKPITLSLLHLETGRTSSTFNASSTPSATSVVLQATTLPPQPPFQPLPRINTALLQPKMGSGSHAQDLLHSALNRHAAAALSTPPSLSHLTLSDDEDRIDVRTPLPSAPGTPTLSRGSTPSSSRSTSPSRKGKGAGKPRRDKTKEREKAEANKSSMDPLAKFPGEINGRIFGELGVDDLLSCGRVCKKWRKSQTMSASSLSSWGAMGAGADARRRLSLVPHVRGDSSTREPVAFVRRIPGTTDLAASGFKGGLGGEVRGDS